MTDVAVTAELVLTPAARVASVVTHAHGVSVEGRVVDAVAMVAAVVASALIHYKPTKRPLSMS